MTMIRFALAFFFVAQSLYTQENENHHLLTDSSRSIQFGFSYFEFRTFNNRSISYKQHLASGSAIRAGVRIGGDMYTSESTKKLYRNDTLISSTNSSESPDPRVDADVNVMYLWYSVIEKELFLFYGFGPTFGYSKRRYLGTERETHWSFGISGGIGAEWFASRSISLHAEYNSVLLYRRSKTEDWYSLSPGEKTFEIRSTDSWNVSEGSVLFGTSIYF